MGCNSSRNVQSADATPSFSSNPEPAANHHHLKKTAEVKPHQVAASPAGGRVENGRPGTPAKPAPENQGDAVERSSPAAAGQRPPSAGLRDAAAAPATGTEEPDAAQPIAEVGQPTAAAAAGANPSERPASARSSTAAGPETTPGPAKTPVKDESGGREEEQDAPQEPRDDGQIGEAAAAPPIEVTSGGSPSQEPPAEAKQEQPESQEAPAPEAPAASESPPTEAADGSADASS